MTDDFENENGPEASPAPEAAAEAPSTPSDADAAASHPDDELDWDKLRAEFEGSTQQAEPAFNWEQFQNEQALQQRESEIGAYQNQLEQIAQRVHEDRERLDFDRGLAWIEKKHPEFATLDKDLQEAILLGIHARAPGLQQAWANRHEDPKTMDRHLREVGRVLQSIFDEAAMRNRVDEDATAAREAVSAAVRWASSSNPPKAPAKYFGSMSGEEFAREVSRVTGFTD